MGDPTDRLDLELTAAEARIVVAALRQYEPYWPCDLDDLSREWVLSEVRVAIDHVLDALRPGLANNA